MDKNTITIHRIRPSEAKKKPDDSTLTFGRVFSDHFFIIDRNKQGEWLSAKIEPYRPLQLDPSSVCLHYGQMVFEGLKAYCNKRNEILLFRWQKNAERMRTSCRRLMMDCVDEQMFGRAIKTLILLERDWIPKDPECSLYVRPNIIGTDAYLGVHPAEEYKFYVLVCPVGAYYREGFAPVSILVEDQDVRAVRGGLGSVKTAANYAHSLRAQARAASKGFTQVLWLDAIEQRWVEEVGTMNIFFVIKDELITPPLEGSILPGVTRDSVITIAKHWGIKVVERAISIDEVIATAQSGDLQECFGTGTAAVISPVGLFSYRGSEYLVSNNKTGPLAQRLYDFITAIQHGDIEDLFGWVERIDHLNIEELANG
ncbi:MAG: branched-chain amino acid aminotransferase [Deltaproteobacteria bacterium]|nr:branched-chain amino acid aminotransferase [Deltaproteobacteria bacterium]